MLIINEIAGKQFMTLYSIDVISVAIVDLWVQ